MEGNVVRNMLCSDLDYINTLLMVEARKLPVQFFALRGRAFLLPDDLTGLQPIALCGSFGRLVFSLDSLYAIGQAFVANRARGNRPMDFPLTVLWLRVPLTVQPPGLAHQNRQSILRYPETDPSLLDVVAYSMSPLRLIRSAIL